MSDPERLSIASDNELERLLLRSGRAPAPEESRRRALIAATAVLGAGGLAAGSAAASSAAGSVAAKTGSVLSLKWLAFFGVAGLGAMTAAVAMNDRPLANDVSHRVEGASSPVMTVRPPFAPRGASNSAALPAARPVDDTAATASAAVSPAPSSTRPGTVPAGATSSAESSVHAELATLEQARGALAAGDPARTLSILDAYSTAYPHGSMGPEATVLRVEALVRAGDRSAAARLGNGFLAGNPQSPYSERIRSLLGESNP